MTDHRIVFVAPDFQILGLTGPHEVFSQAGRHSQAGPGYRIDAVAAAPGRSGPAAGSPSPRR
ncbi:hypothetical protein G3I60_18045 [Streptomyces sp. SID13666]|uniref:hypothetical protein n=1 Tax=unclassified Streptomyces TaxID=2593676 RepID=UPI0013C0AF23|nr:MULTISPECIES: hypothetical protein [unclassified Streptomyces]NEA55998.1 hypothetical protein [Streptomyces sp. SID13666]NEA72021.1 hypothetical protein [Streptomyces sp. SID13588]